MQLGGIDTRAVNHNPRAHFTSGGLQHKAAVLPADILHAGFQPERHAV